jgi:hypothetical protein
MKRDWKQKESPEAYEGGPTGRSTKECRDITADVKISALCENGRQCRV